ncbi:hypothetical protein DCAR_0622760 [Daucus carota subsp. sativus]|uniref:Uncharacterized protein n=1 Tax=Daucus carota subsp. sativus TaxID=79200 RepID=A0A161X9W4_DAUCS|nr:PREDICTED: plastid division protein CDP1, chloroplastic [Daucus carota subsp. sativus]WOH03363.1 hypothetical protein DCAR_0622760 [Daucus carota subsp. sativus]
MVTIQAVPELCVRTNNKLLSSKSNNTEICGYTSGLTGSPSDFFGNGGSSCVGVLNVYGRRRRCGRWRVRAAARSDVNVRVIEKSSGSSGSGSGNVNGNRSGLVDIPVSCYQLLGVPDQAEKDEIVKAVMHLKSSEIDEGYTTDAVVSRQNLLVDVRDKLLFEPEYAGNLRANILPKASLRIPWAWLPGALCLLQEVGEEKRVLDIGRSALNHADSKLYTHDLLLSMALAECAIAKISFEKNKISQGFEALARAQCLLRSHVSFGQMSLLSQIEESLEELAPACTLEILGMPNTPENAERRLGANAALRELLRQGLDVEATCQVQDWPSFLYQALRVLMAAEIVELLPWEKLASIRRNRKSIESQNQRIVIDFHCFYLALIAHIAVGFSTQQRDLISKAKVISESLIASEGTDLKFEESFCLYLLGQGDESVAAEKLRQINLNSTTTSRTLISGKESREVPSANQSLESWMKENVLLLFPDTRDCSSSLENYFAGEKKAGKKQYKRAQPIPSSINLRPLSHGTFDRKTYEQPDSSPNSSQHLGTAVNQLSPSNSQAPSIAVKVGNNDSLPSVQLKRNLGAQNYNVWAIWFGEHSLGGNLIVVTALGFILFVTFKLLSVRLWRSKFTSGWALTKPKTDASSAVWSDSSLQQIRGPAFNKENSIISKLKQILSSQKVQLRSSSEARASKTSSLDDTSTLKTAVYKSPMHVEEAENLVKQWQTTKAEALGPNHQVSGLFEVLDEAMLIQWQSLADEAQKRSCFWRFLLLQLSILKADILLDEIGNEMAEIEALLEEAAELVDAKQQTKNPNYYSTYTIRYLLKRQEDGSWRFCEGTVQIA